MHEDFEEKYISKVSILELSMEGVEGYRKSIGFREGSKGQYILFPPLYFWYQIWGWSLISTRDPET